MCYSSMTVYVSMHYKDHVAISLDILVYFGSNMSHLIEFVLCELCYINQWPRTTGGNHLWTQT